MRTLLNDKNRRGTITFELLSHRVSSDINVEIKGFHMLGDKKLIITLDREELVKTIGAMK